MQASAGIQRILEGYPVERAHHKTEPLLLGLGCIGCVV